MVPSLLELEVMYVMFSTPLIDSSSGVATLRATTSALAPGYLAVTSTLGGAISGKREMGSVKMDRPPSISKMIDTTVDNTGLSINLFSIQ
jgi:hypothetical protein